MKYLLIVQVVVLCYLSRNYRQNWIDKVGEADLDSMKQNY